MRNRLASRLLTLGLLLFASGASALHIDVNVSAVRGQLKIGFCGNRALACDSLPVLSQLGIPANTLPVDLATGSGIFVTDFGDLAGGNFAVASPGFFAGAGALPGNLLLRYEALGNLRYWDPARDVWRNQTPRDERIRLFGGLDAQTVISTDRSHCNGLLICIPREVQSTVYAEGSTLFTDTRITGARSLIVDRTANNGSLHAHLDWFLELPSGARTGSAGAYLLELRMTAEGYRPSDPFMIMFKRGISDAEFGQALAARIIAPAVVLPPVVRPPAAVPLPASGILLGFGMVSLVLARKQRRA
jgi:hypothetical protein